MRVAPLKSLEFAFMSLSLNILTDPDEDPARTKLFMVRQLFGDCANHVNVPLFAESPLFALFVPVDKPYRLRLHQILSQQFS